MAKRLGDLLLEEGLITQAQLKKALQEQTQSGGFLGSILVAQGALTEEKLVDVLVRQPGITKIDSSRLKPNPSLLTVITEQVARKRRCLPVQQTGKLLQVAMVDPLDDATVDFLAQMTGLTIQPCAMAPSEFERLLPQFYGGGEKAEAPKKKEKAGEKVRAEGSKQEIPRGKALDDLVARSVEEVSDAEIAAATHIDRTGIVPLEIDEHTSPVIRIVNALLLKATELGASDIHIEPQEEQLRVRYRVDGVLRTIYKLPIGAKNPLTSRIKIMAEMDVAEHRIPQDGRIKLDLGERGTVELRANTLPGVYGEKVVLRLLGTGQLKGRVADIGFAPDELEAVENALAGHFGMILVTGPTGSGKSTTLYTMLNQVNTEAVNIVTAEDPVEYNLPGLHQVPIRPQIGFTFEVALRSFLRQDPNIILVGEMRDYETAAIAIKAALTGHLVLSTLHTNDAPSTVVRLVDMGIEPYLVASAVKLVIAQRLVRKICEACREEAPSDTAEKTDLSESVLAAIEKVYRGRGCEACNFMGTKGRMPIFEVMPIRTREMRRVITEGGTEVQVAMVARKEGLRTLKDSALNLINRGIIPLEEGIRVALAD